MLKRMVRAALGRWATHVVGLQSEVAAILTGLFPLSRDEPTGRVIEFDCVMVRADALPPA